MTDKKGKIFGKINIVDLFVVIIIIAAIVLTYFKFNLSEHSDVVSSNVKAQYTILITSLRDYTIDALEVGDKVYDEETEKCIGTITDKKIEDAYEYLTKTDGSIVYAKLPERQSVRLTVETDAVMNEKGIVINGSKTLHNNQGLVIYTQKVQTSGQVLDVKTIDK